MKYNERLKELRREQNISQREMARKLYVSQKVISQFEMGLRELSKRMLRKYAKYFKVEKDYILGITDEP